MARIPSYTTGSRTLFSQCLEATLHPLKLVLLALACLHLPLPASHAATYSPSRSKPPAIQREFRGTWVASVGNIDWPSKPGLPVDQQKAELLTILNRAEQLKLNAVVLQIRPACDALYASRIEPWSEYLSGQAGKAPEPFYDPLAFAVKEAHQRGLEMHAWFNPFRARHPSAKTPTPTNHVNIAHPQWVKTYGKQLWLDPGEPGAQKYSLGVIFEVVRRYDIDGVHLDDYYYPYREKDSSGREIDFPDDPSWTRYQKSGGLLNREDWRRDNVNGFIERLYSGVHQIKPWVKVGLSPFGIWRKGTPPGIKGLDAYEQLYADSKKWINEGWMDYCTPQLYWSIASKETCFPVLLQWWASQNSRQRHLWPGMNTAKVASGWLGDEISQQIRITRQVGGVSGHMHWSVGPLLHAADSNTNNFTRVVYGTSALIPASPWLSAASPDKPRLYAASNPKSSLSTFSWEPTGTEKVWLWVIQRRYGKVWMSQVLPGHHTTAGFNARTPIDAIAVTAINRCGIASPPTVLERKGK